MTVIDVTDETFQTEVLDKSKQVPVVVDLWAEWCGPCKTLGPILEKVVGATDGKVVLAKVDVDANPGLSQAFKVQSIPAVYALKDGAVVDGFMGSYPENTVQEFVDALLPVPGSRRRSASSSPPATKAACGWRCRWSRRTKTPSSSSARCSSHGATPTKRWRCSNGSPSRSAHRHVAAKARVGDAPTDDYDDKLTTLLAQVKSRRRRTPGVRRPARADGFRRSAHRRVPSKADRSPVLTIERTVVERGV